MADRPAGSAPFAFLSYASADRPWALAIAEALAHP